jgi:hypothetical protein
MLKLEKQMLKLENKIWSECKKCLPHPLMVGHEKQENKRTKKQFVSLVL